MTESSGPSAGMFAPRRADHLKSSKLSARLPVLSGVIVALVFILAYIACYTVKTNHTREFYGNSLHYAYMTDDIISSLQPDNHEPLIWLANIFSSFATIEGERPFFIALGAYCKMIMHTLGFVYPIAHLTIINLIGMGIIAFCGYKILSGVYAPLAGFLWIIFLSINFGIYYDALCAHHNITGAASLFIALAVDLSVKQKRIRHYLCMGFFTSSSIIFSPSLLPAMVIFLAIKTFELIRSRILAGEKHFIFFVLGTSTPVLYIISADFLRNILDITYESFFYKIFKQVFLTGQFSAAIPTLPLYYFDYLAQSEGFYFLSLSCIAIILLPILYGRADRLQKKALCYFTAMALATYLFFTFADVSAISRLYIMSTLGLIFCISITLAALIKGEVLKRFGRAGVYLSLITTVLATGFGAYNFFSKHALWTRIDSEPAYRDRNHPGMLVIQTNMLAMSELKPLARTVVGAQTAGNTLIKVSASYKIGNQTYKDSCVVEKYIHTLTKLGLKPYTVDEIEFIPNSFFLNQYFYYIFYKNSNYGHFRGYEFMQNFPWQLAKTYRFSDIVEYDKKLIYPLFHRDGEFYLTE